MPAPETPVTAESVIAALRRAGVTELLLPGRGCRPAEYRTAWPAYQGERYDYAPEDAEAPRPTPTAADITHHRLVCDWLSALPVPYRQRRVLSLRKLTWWPGHALDGEPRHAWPDIAVRVGADPRLAETLWESGVHRLAIYLDRQSRIAATAVRVQVAWALRPPGAGLCHVVRPARAALPSAPVVDGIRACQFG